MGKQASTDVGTVSAGESQKFVSDFLGLPDCTTLRHDPIEHILFVRTMYAPQISGACPFCGGPWNDEYTVLALEPFWDIPGEAVRSLSNFLSHGLPAAHANFPST